MKNNIEKSTLEIVVAFLENLVNKSWWIVVIAITLSIPWIIFKGIKEVIHSVVLLIMHIMILYFIVMFLKIYMYDLMPVFYDSLNNIVSNMFLYLKNIGLYNQIFFFIYYINIITTTTLCIQLYFKNLNKKRA